MRIVDDGHEHLAGAVEPEGLLDEEFFAVVVLAVELDLERGTEDAERVVIGVERAVDHRRDQALGIVMDERRFQDAFADAGFAEHETKTALLGVDFQNVEDFLLVREERGRLGVEGIFLETEVGADHGGIGFRI